MLKSKLYGLSFTVVRYKNHKNYPRIIPKNSQLSVILAGYFEPFGPRQLLSMLKDINALNNPVNGYEVHGGENNIAEIFSPPERVCFGDTNGGYLELPLNDFIDILNEWREFLISLPYKHSLSDS